MLLKCFFPLSSSISVTSMSEWHLQDMEEGNSSESGHDIDWIWEHAVAERESVIRV